jgi:hypothetical protein
LDESRMLGVMIQNVLIRNHFYVFVEVIWRLTYGEAIRLKSTGLVSKCVMKFFDSLFLAKLSNTNQMIELYKGYIDDIDMISREVKLETWLIEGRLE